MSNYNYKVDSELGLLVVRVPGENADKFVSRKKELYHISLIEDLKINQEIIYLDVESGIKISKYVEGQLINANNLENLELIKLFKNYHSLLSTFDYHPFLRIEEFESYCDNQSEEYFQLKEKLLYYKDYLQSQNKVFCHNDSQPFNMILGSDQIYLLDWEYAGNNDPVYDLVCFSEDYGADNENISDDLLRSYFGEINFDLKKRKILWTIFQSLQWYNVALFKENTGMSAKLDVDFNKVCEFFIDKSKIKFKELRRLENE